VIASRVESSQNDSFVSRIRNGAVASTAVTEEAVLSLPLSFMSLRWGGTGSVSLGDCGRERDCVQPQDGR
jgi:hypothetical protein